MNNEDRPVGRVLSRRAAVVLLGAAGFAVLAVLAGVFHVALQGV